MGQDSEPPAASTGPATRRTALAIWWAMLSGALGLTVLAVVVGPGIWSRVDDAVGAVVAWFALAMAVACFVAARVLPGLVKPAPGATAEGVTGFRSTVATALNGYLALFAPLAWMVSGKPVALVALATSLAGMLLAVPTRRRWDELRRAVTVAFGRELEAGANAPPPGIPRPLLAYALTLCGLAAALLVLGAHAFWTSEVLHRPQSPLARAAMPFDLALMMTTMAAFRFARAAAHRHPRRQRAHAVVLVLFAALLFAQALRSR